MAPSSGSDLLLAKILANFLFVSVVEIVLAPVFMVMYNLRIVGNGWPRTKVIAAGHLGAGGQRHVLRGPVDPEPQPRIAACR